MSNDQPEREVSASRAPSSYTPALDQRTEQEVYPNVRDFMDKTFIRLRVDMPVYAAIDVLLDRNITGAAVVDDQDNLVGILSEKDCLRTLLQGAYDGLPGGKVRDYMTSDVMTISPHVDIMSVVRIFTENVFRRLLVVENGRLVGQVTRRDLLRTIRQLLQSKKKGSFH